MLESLQSAALRAGSPGSPEGAGEPNTGIQAVFYCFGPMTLHKRPESTLRLVCSVWVDAHRGTLTRPLKGIDSTDPLNGREEASTEKAKGYSRPRRGGLKRNTCSTRWCPRRQKNPRFEPHCAESYENFWPSTSFADVLATVRSAELHGASGFARHPSRYA